MKFVIELPSAPDDSSTPLQPGTVWHTFGYPEPEIFGFLYVHPDRLVPWHLCPLVDGRSVAHRLSLPAALHPAPGIWQHLKDGTLRSWGAKSLEESGTPRRALPHRQRICAHRRRLRHTNMLTGSGVDEAWTTGTQLAESVIELLHDGKPFTKEFLAATYEAKRRQSWVERGAREAKNARNGFHGGSRPRHGRHGAGRPHRRKNLTERQNPADLQADSPDSLAVQGRLEAQACAELALLDGRPLHDALMTLRGWPEIRIRRAAPHLTPGCAPHGRQGSGDARLRRPCRLQEHWPLHQLRRPYLHRHVLRSGNHTGP